MNLYDKIHKGNYKRFKELEDAAGELRTTQQNLEAARRRTAKANDYITHGENENLKPLFDAIELAEKELAIQQLEIAIEQHKLESEIQSTLDEPQLG